mgnify:CR=1 FL=1
MKKYFLMATVLLAGVAAIGQSLEDINKYMLDTLRTRYA